MLIKLYGILGATIHEIKVGDSIAYGKELLQHAIQMWVHVLAIHIDDDRKLLQQHSQWGPHSSWEPWDFIVGLTG